MGNEFHQSVEQPSFGVDSDSDGDESGFGTSGCVFVHLPLRAARDHPNHTTVNRECSSGPLDSAAPSSGDIVESLLDSEILELRLFLMSKQKGDVMRRILRHTAKRRMNAWEVDPHRVLIAYSPSVEAFNALGGVVELEFIEQTAPVGAHAKEGAGEHEQGQATQETDMSEGAFSASPGAEGKVPRSRVWGTVLVYLATVLAVYFVSAAVWMMMHISGYVGRAIAYLSVRVGRALTILRYCKTRVGRALVMLYAARYDLWSIAASGYLSSQNFVREAAWKGIRQMYRLLQMGLEFVLPRLEVLRDYTAAAQLPL
ncbi:hypothetical protein NMY22_g15024 [Coprinellus aureogranulatus]|nr:hypothetical protein NMY22_g15024 [Coprinellus aureogranulatus]